jgi:hypothetical protein
MQARAHIRSITNKSVQYKYKLGNKKLKGDKNEKYIKIIVYIFHINLN